MGGQLRRARTPRARAASFVTARCCRTHSTALCPYRLRICGQGTSFLGLSFLQMGLMDVSPCLVGLRWRRGVTLTKLLEQSLLHLFTSPLSPRSLPAGTPRVSPPHSHPPAPHQPWRAFLVPTVTACVSAGLQESSRCESLAGMPVSRVSQRHHGTSWARGGHLLEVQKRLISRCHTLFLSLMRFL